MFLREFCSDYSLEVLNEINLAAPKNKQLLKHFLLFFVVAICGYLSIITSRYPHDEDYCRYILNYTCGLNGRCANTLLEYITYFSKVITDASPFTQILSCGVLAYTAVICTTIAKANGWALLCFIPILVNPFLFENMSFKFDNIFMALAMLISVVASYLASKNDKRTLIFQIIFLFYVLLTYQAALSAYFIIFFYCLLKEISSDTPLKAIAKKMQYWIYGCIIPAMLYLPIISQINYSRKNGELFLIPNSSKNLKRIIDNLLQYFYELKEDWLYNNIGMIITGFFLLFFIHKIWENYINNNSPLKILLAISVIMLFWEAPLGINIFLHYLDSEMNSFIPPRILYCFGIMLSLLLYENYKFLNASQYISKLYKLFLFLFGIWNLIFCNSLGNIAYYQQLLKHAAMQELSEDLRPFLKNGKESLFFCFTGSLITPALSNFGKVYPIAYKTATDLWEQPYLYTILLYEQYLFSNFKTEIDYSNRYLFEKFSFKESDCFERKLLKQGKFYDLYMFNKKVLCVSFKTKTKETFYFATRLVDKKDSRR